MRKKILFDKVYELTFEELYEKVEKFIQKTINSFYNIQTHVYDRDDLFQTACLSLWKAYDTYKFDSGIKFLTYFSRIMNNDILMLNRKISKEKEKIILESSLEYSNNNGETYSIFDTFASNDNPEEDYINKSLINEILKDLEKYSHKDIVIDIAEGKKQSELSIKYGISQTYVSKIYYSFIKKEKEKNKRLDALDLKSKEIYVNKGGNKMAKLDEQKLKNYLLENANPNINISTLIKEYCEKNNIPESTVFTALIKRMPIFYGKIKDMCRNGSDKKTPATTQTVNINIDEAKKFIEDKVKNKKDSLSRAMLEYSKIAKCSVTTIRNHILKSDQNFMKDMKKISEENYENKMKDYKSNNNLLTVKESNIMPVDIVNTFDLKELVTEKPTLIVQNNVSNKIETLFKDLIDATVAFSGQDFHYDIGNYGIKLIDINNSFSSKKIMNVEGIKKFISELETAVEISEALF